MTSQNYNQTSSHEKQQFSQIKLISENLVPIYLIEDNLKSNFRHIQIFINQLKDKNEKINQKMIQMISKVEQVDTKFVQELQKLQKRISNSIRQQLQSTIKLILNEKLSEVLQKQTSSQEQQQIRSKSLDDKIQKLQQQLKYEIAQDNQKYFMSQITKIQKDINKKIESGFEKNNLFKSTSNQIRKSKQDILSSQKGEDISNHNSIPIETKQIIQQLQQKVMKLQEFNKVFDKKFYEEFQSLKQNWKQIGTELLENKKIMTKKMDTLSVEFTSIKNIKDFSKMPLEMEDSFKKKILEKFIQFQKMLSILATKSQFEMTNQRTKKTLTRHNQQLLQIRQKLSQNSEYFTLYMNNSNNENLIESIEKIRIDTTNDKNYYDSLFESIKNKQDQLDRQTAQIGKSLEQIQDVSQTHDEKMNKLTNNLIKLLQRIQSLQDLNDINPRKMNKIHDTLDMGLSFPVHSHSQQLQPSRIKQLIQNKELKYEIEKLKDSIILLGSTSVEQQIVQLRTELKKLNQKLQKLKKQSEDALMARKPWVCLSCDRQKGILQGKQIKQVKQRKKSLVEGKAGGFLTNRSQKSIKVVQDKFQVYQKFREKYLSQGMKLPQIYKQKLGYTEQMG